MASGKQEKPQDKALYPPVSPVEAGMKCRCPRCGEGRLFDGVLVPGKACMNCGLDYSFIDSGDGPAVFVILIIGFFFIALALGLQSVLPLPLWAQVLFWTPFIIVFSVLGLRIAKALLIAYQYQTKAEQGTLDQGSSDSGNDQA